MVAGCAIKDFVGHNKHSNLESRPTLVCETFKTFFRSEIV